MRWGLLEDGGGDGGGVRGVGANRKVGCSVLVPIATWQRVGLPPCANCALHEEYTETLHLQHSVVDVQETSTLSILGHTTISEAPEPAHRSYPTEIPSLPRNLLDMAWNVVVKVQSHRQLVRRQTGGWTQGVCGPISLVQMIYNAQIQGNARRVPP